MNCPFCGIPMKSGVLKGIEEVYWHSQEFAENFRFRSLLTVDGWRKLLSEPTTIETPLDGEWMPLAPEVPAHCCPSCHKFIFTGRVTDD